MTKEQEAIERCKSIVRVNKDFLKGNKQTINQKEIDCIETVLNMLKEKDELYHKALGDLVKADRENIRLKKQIDLMARAIDNYDSQLEINTFKDKEHVKQYFKEIAKGKVKNGRKYKKKVKWNRRLYW
mgnify:CR=1 FL=1